MVDGLVVHLKTNSRLEQEFVTAGWGVTVCADTKGTLCWVWWFHTTRPELSCGRVNVRFLPGRFFGLISKLGVRESYSTCDVTVWKRLHVLYGKRSCWSPRDVGGRGSPNYYFLWVCCFFFLTLGQSYSLRCWVCCKSF